MDSFKNKVTMAIEDWYNVESEDGNYEFAYGTVDFLSTKPNSHKHVISEEVLKEYAPTVINKWVIAYYDDITNDVTTHVSNQHIIGRVPEQEVKYRYDSDGYLIASVDVILSKLYATDVYNLFKQHNYRAVSIEELVGFSDETENLTDGIQEKIVEGFNITAISVLGLSYRPSVPDANIQLTKMSEIDDTNIQEVEKEYIVYSQNKNNNITMEKIIKKLDDIAESVKSLSKEEKMAELETKVEELESKEAETYEAEKEAEMAEQPEEMGYGGKEEEMSETSTNADDEVVENADSEDKEDDNDKDDSDDSEEKMSEVNMAELKTKLAEAEEKIQKYESEISELKKFKEKVQMSEKQNVVNETLAHVKEFLTEKEYKAVVKKADECSYEEIGLWKNETLASIADKALEKIASLSNSKEDGVLDMGIPQEVTEKKSIYD